MFKDDRYWTMYKYWRYYKPEEELYMRLKDNPFWPFKQIGDGYFYVVFRSDRVSYGIWILFFAILSCVIVYFVLGVFGLAVGLFLIVFIFGGWALHGKLAWRELIISRRGRGKYMLRMFRNEEILFQSELRNVYIRLVRKYDANGDPYFCLMLGGYEMDDHRLTRMTKAEEPLRIMGMRISYRVGINFFDWKDESEEHYVWHYKTHSTLKYKTYAEVIYRKMSTAAEEIGEPSPEGSYLSVPNANRGTLRNPNQDDDADDDLNQKRKVRISTVINVRTV